MERPKKVVIMDGQGGKIGKMLVEQIKRRCPAQELIAIGTNSVATSAMLKAGADMGATGENPVLVNCEDADLIVGPVGIVMANSLLGEITPAMAVAVGKSPAQKILVPVNRCHVTVAGVGQHTMAEYVETAAKLAAEFIQNGKFAHEA